jgi:hypothetical protein
MIASQRRRIMNEEKEQYWTSHIANWRASGLSQAAYCKQNYLSKSTFGHWKRKLGNLNAQSEAPVVVPVTFERSSPTNFAKPIRLHVAGFQLEIEPGFCKQTLRDLLSVLTS